MNIWLRAALVVFVALPSAGARGQNAAAERRIKECGVNSLYCLLQLCSAEVDLAELRATLPATRAKGLSMVELQTAASRSGVPLRGRRIDLGDIPIDRPMIAYLRMSAEQGHFVVLEPVGLLGKSVMILDFPRPAQIMAYSDLMRDDRWTGLVLSPVKSWERFGPWVVSGVGLLVLGFGLASPWLRFGKRRRARPAAIGGA